MRSNEFTTEVINTEIIKPNFYAEKNISLPDIGKLKFVAKSAQSPRYAPQFTVFVYNENGEKIGHFRFLVMNYDPEPKYKIFSKFMKQKDQYVIGANVSVYREYQRKGIARAVYSWVKSMGNDMKPSPTQSDAGKAMWRGFEKSPL